MCRDDSSAPELESNPVLRLDVDLAAEHQEVAKGQRVEDVDQVVGRTNAEEVGDR